MLADAVIRVAAHQALAAYAQVRSDASLSGVEDAPSWLPIAVLVANLPIVVVVLYAVWKGYYVSGRELKDRDAAHAKELAQVSTQLAYTEARRVEEREARLRAEQLLAAQMDVSRAQNQTLQDVLTEVARLSGRGPG